MLSRLYSKGLIPAEIFSSDRATFTAQGSQGIISASGNPATLVKLVPWWKREYAPSVTASKDYYEQIGQAS